MKRVTLEIQYADKRSEMKQLDDGTYIIGRDTGDIVLKSTLVSGRHGVLKVSGSQIVYTDQGSTNGTFTMNGSRLTGPLQMTAGTGLRIGECKLILKAIHVLTSKTVMQASVKPAFSSTRTVLGQPAMIPPPASVPPAAPQPAMTASPKPFSTPPQAASPMVTPAAPPPASVAPAQPSVAPGAANAATEPAPPPYAMDSSAAAPAAAAASDSFSENTSSAIAADSGGAAGGGGTGASASMGGGWSYNMDFGQLINAPMQDKGWIMKCLVIGLITIIPIAGALNMMGWLIAIYNNRKQGGEELPAANLSYIGDGVKVLLAWLPAIGAYVAVSIVMTILTIILPFLWFLTPIINLALGLAVFAIAPAVMYLCIEKDVQWASLKINDIKAFAQANTESYVQLLIAFLVASIVSGLGGIVFIGALITMPFGAAMQAVILADIKEE